ncbi:unnamed protein product [Brassica oleracea]
MIARRITPISSAKNIYDRNSDELNDTDEEEGSGLQKTSLKQEIISMVSITHKDDQIVESKEITPISSPKNTYETNSDELNDTDEEEVVEIELEEMRAAHVVSIGSAALRSLTPYCEAGYVFTLALMSVAAKIDGVSHGYLQNVDVIVTPTTGYVKTFHK